MRRLATTLSALGFIWACAATIYLLAGAGYDGVRVDSALAASEAEVGHLTVSLFSANGPWIAGLLVGVALFSGIPFGVALRHPAGQRVWTWTAALVLLGFSMISGFTVGLMYLPVAVVLFASAVLTVRPVAVNE